MKTGSAATSAKASGKSKGAPGVSAASAAAARAETVEVPHLSALFRALGDETRLEILERLARVDDSLCVCDIEGCFDLSQPTVSHHMKVLRNAGLVTCERRGTWVHCAIDERAIARIAAFASRIAPAAAKRSKKGNTT